MRATINSIRHGFTFIELAVVGAVAAVIAALLLPAVGATREAARRSQCQDNLHNIAIAMHNYESVYKVFPPGWIHAAANRSNYGWGMSILPFIEQKPLYDSLSFDGGMAQALLKEETAMVMETVISTYRCPSDVGPKLNTQHVPTDKKDKPHKVATSNYLGINGSKEWTWGLGAQPPRKKGGQLRGFFGENSNTRFRDILDGMSNTVMAGERAWQIDSRDKEAPICGAGIAYGVGGDGKTNQEEFHLATSRHGINARGEDEKEGLHCRVGISSAHPGGAQVGIGDARVSFFSEEMDQEMIDHLFDKDDGNPVQVP